MSQKVYSFRDKTNNIDEALDKALSGCTLDERILLYLKYARNLPYRAIAEIQKTPFSTLRDRFTRLLSRISDEFRHENNSITYARGL